MWRFSMRFVKYVSTQTVRINLLLAEKENTHDNIATINPAECECNLQSTELYKIGKLRNYSPCVYDNFVNGRNLTRKLKEK